MIADQPIAPALIVSADQVKTLLAALDDGAEYKRDRAATCADCADQPCIACQWRLQAADAYDHLATLLTQATKASGARQQTPGHATADREAGQ